MEALDLEGKDKFLGGLIKGKSDPYGVLQIGNQLFQSKTVKESLHPKWNEVYEVRDDPHPGSNHLDFYLFTSSSVLLSATSGLGLRALRATSGDRAV